MILVGDCKEQMAKMSDNSVDSIVTDPPYGLEFMGKEWDKGVPPIGYWLEALRIVKTGGYLLSFGGSRTYHRMACAIEDAGFEIRDQIMWVYGSGFPKSLNVGKAIDKVAGHAQTKKWEGWGTALKPAHEPIVMARKPFAGKVASNVLSYGTGALNIDSCRIRISAGDEPSAGNRTRTFGNEKAVVPGGEASGGWSPSTKGRWPANFIHDGSDGVTELLSESARFFYCAKANKKERNAGLGYAKTNHHPTVKPLALMRYLVRLVTPPSGIVFDPFLGSGTTAVAAILEGFEWSGCEITPEYLPIIKRRAAWAREQVTVEK